MDAATSNLTLFLAGDIADKPTKHAVGEARVELPRATNKNTALLIL